MTNKRTLFLMSEIKAVADDPNKYCHNPGRDFFLNRKLSFETVLKSIIGIGSRGLANELIDIFGHSLDMPSASAFVQQRSKIKPDALKDIFTGFTDKVAGGLCGDEMRILAADGSDIQIATDPDDEAIQSGRTGSHFFKLKTA